MILYIKRRAHGHTDGYIAECLSAYCAEYGSTCGNAEVRRTPQGKPYVADDSLQIGVSHSRSHLFIAIADLPFGLDAEPCSRQLSHRSAVCSRFFSAAEQRQIAAAAAQDAAFLQLWVKKEAWLKFRGTGLSELAAADTMRLSGRFYTFCEVGHYIAVYAEAALDDIKIKNETIHI